MNKTAIKNFAIWARNKLIADITYKAGLLGITEKAIKSPLSQSTKDVQFFDIGTKEPYSISGIEIKQREALATVIRNKEQQADYSTAYKAVIEEVAYTWFNRLIAVRFMEVNDYLPSRIRVLSSESTGKDEPDLVTNPFDTDLEFTPYEKDRIIQLKQENQLDELFRMLFIKQCNALNAILPNLFEKTSDYTELLLNVAFTDKDGVVYRLVHDIPEDDFNVSKEGQVEIIGWLYQYYNTEPKAEAFSLLNKNVKITKEHIPAATQLFTPDWIVRYMVENSLGRLWLEGHPNNALKSEWKYYLDEAEQQAEVQKQLDAIREEYKAIKPEDIKVIDPCMGSGHILVYAFDVLMQIYESYGYSQRDAAKSIIENNLYGLDIDNRAYQLAYFAVMMKARQYNRRILNADTKPHVYAIQESNGINRDQLQYFGASMNEMQRNIATLQVEELLDTFIDAKEYGSILNVENYDWELLRQFVEHIGMIGQLSFDIIGIEYTQAQLRLLIEIGAVMARKYDVVVTNPPYMKSDNMTSKLSEYVISYKQNVKYDLYAAFICICRDYLKENGIMSMITMHNFMFAPSFQELRNELKLWDWISLLHLGSRAFSEISGEVVQTVAYVIAKSNSNRNLYVIDVTDEKVPDNKKKSFLESKDQGYTFNLKNIDLIPCNAFGYSLGNQIIELYKNKQILDNFGVSKAGVVTGADEYFIKFWYEIDNNKITYFPKPNELYDYVLFSKGGSFAKWYGNSQHILRLNDMWDDTKTNKSVRRGDTSFYYKRGIGWSQMGGGV